MPHSPITRRRFIQEAEAGAAALAVLARQESLRMPLIVRHPAKIAPWVADEMVLERRLRRAQRFSPRVTFTSRPHMVPVTVNFFVAGS